MTLGIRQIYTTFLLLLSVSSANITLANDDAATQSYTPEPLNADKIKHIQSISQAILQVRGQQRQQVNEETLPILNVVDQVRAALPQLRYDAQQASLTANQTDIQQATVTIDGQSWLQQLWQDLLYILDQPPASRSSNDITAAESVNDQLTILIQQLQEQGQAIEQDLPPVWAFWEASDPHKQAMVDKLTEIIEQLETTQQAVLQEKPQQLQHLEEQLKQPAAVLPDPDPTITTMTRHITQ